MWCFKNKEITKPRDSTWFEFIIYTWDRLRVSRNTDRRQRTDVDTAASLAMPIQDKVCKVM